jgi:hypothetical protein
MCKRGSAKHSFMENIASLREHAILRHPPTKQTPQPIHKEFCVFDYITEIVKRTKVD